MNLQNYSLSLESFLWQVEGVNDQISHAFELLWCSWAHVFMFFPCWFTDMGMTWVCLCTYVFPYGVSLKFQRSLGGANPANVWICLINRKPQIHSIIIIYHVKSLPLLTLPWNWHTFASPYPNPSFIAWVSLKRMFLIVCVSDVFMVESCSSWIHFNPQKSARLMVLSHVSPCFPWFNPPKKDMFFGHSFGRPTIHPSQGEPAEKRAEERRVWASVQHGTGAGGASRLFQ